MFVLAPSPARKGGVGWGQALGFRCTEEPPNLPCNQGEEPLADTVNRRRGLDVCWDLLHITMPTLRPTAGPADGKRDGRSSDKTTVKRLP